MAYQRHYWKDYDESKTEAQNMENGAVITTERLNEIEIGIVSNQTELDIKKADKTYVDSMLSSIAEGGPRELFYSLTALKNKYPIGAQGIYLVFDSATTDGAHSYMWDTATNSWNDLGVYQASGIKDGTVKQSSLSFSPYNRLDYAKANFDSEIYGGYDQNGNYTITKDATGQILHNYRIYAKQEGVGQAVSVVGQHIGLSETTKVFIGINDAEIIFANLLQNQTTSNYNIEFHMISRGTLVTNIFPSVSNITDSATVKLPHSLCLRQYGYYLAVYFNGNLVQLINSKTYLGSQFTISGSSFRGTASSGISRVRTINTETATIPYMHMSIDDVNSILRDINDNRATYTSIFDNANLAFLKSMHDKYGIVVSLYLFKTTTSFDISNMTSKYRVEFAENAHWLKFGFHSRESGVNYNGTDSSTLVTDYTNTINAIYAFAVPSNLDVIPRFENFGVSMTNQQALISAGLPFEGTYGADDTRELSAGLSGNALTLIQNTDYYFDPKLQLYYPRSETRMDAATSESVVSQLNALSRNVSNNRIYGMFWHQGAELRAEQQAAIEAAAKWAVDHQVKFDFPQNNKPTL